MSAKIGAYLAFVISAATILWLAWIALGFGPTFPYELPFLSVGIAVCIILLLGAKRTAEGKSGGLRLLSGAWGAYSALTAWHAAQAAAGLYVVYHRPPGVNGPETFWLGLALTLAILAVSITGWVLVTTYKEK